MKSWRNLNTISLLLASLVAAGTQPQEAFKAKELLQKDLNAYAGGELVLSIGEIAIAPGASGSKAPPSRPNVRVCSGRRCGDRTRGSAAKSVSHRRNVL
jgi:hypothetical protein